MTAALRYLALASSGLASLALAAGQPGWPPTEILLDPLDLDLPEATAVQVEGAIAADDWRLAEALLYAEASRTPNNGKLQSALGIAHYRMGRNLSAAAALKRSDSAGGLDEQARFLLANAYIRLGRAHWARAELEKLVSSWPAKPTYRLALARLHYEAQRFSEAVRHLQEAMQHQPDLVEAHDLLGQCLEGLGDPGAALAEYRTAVGLNERTNPRSPWPHYHLGSLLHDLGDVGPAREALEVATAIDPRNAPALWELGIVLDKLADLDSARAALEAAAKAAPDDARIQYSLARLYRKIGLRDEAGIATRRFRALSRAGQK